MYLMFLPSQLRHSPPLMGFRLLMPFKYVTLLRLQCLANDKMSYDARLEWKSTYLGVSSAHHQSSSVYIAYMRENQRVLLFLSLRKFVGLRES
jgi:hypothetical protein